MQRKIAERFTRVGGDYLEYPDHAHWILDEIGTERVIVDIARWLDEKGVERSSFAPQEARPMHAA
jgi:hypothetical protein